jgi:uncharacterized DUF497 family protein
MPRHSVYTECVFEWTIVAYTIRRSGDAEAIRLISARPASRRERAAYTAKD